MGTAGGEGNGVEDENKQTFFKYISIAGFFCDYCLVFKNSEMMHM